MLPSCSCSHTILATLGVNSFLQLPPKREGKRRWDSIANLPVLALYVARELVAVGEALRTHSFERVKQKFHLFTYEDVCVMRMLT